MISDLQSDGCTEPRRQLAWILRSGQATGARCDHGWRPRRAGGCQRCDRGIVRLREAVEREQLTSALAGIADA
jgi:hypothetical protein